MVIIISFPPRTMSMIQVPNPVTTSNKTRSQLIPSYTMNLRSKHLLQLQLHRMTTGRGQQQANFQIDENSEPLHELSSLPRGHRSSLRVASLAKTSLSYSILRLISTIASLIMRGKIRARRLPAFDTPKTASSVLRTATALSPREA